MANIGNQWYASVFHDGERGWQSEGVQTPRKTESCKGKEKVEEAKE